MAPVVSCTTVHTGKAEVWMADVAFLVAFAALPVAIWWVSRSVTFVTVGLILGFGIAGNLVQSLIALGMSWNVRGLQMLVLAVLVIVLVIAILRRPAEHASMRRQFLGVVLPALLLGLILIGLRLAAPEDSTSLSAVGYFINHPLAEDNAKWLHLSAQVADGRSISFNGYAGGPLLLMMATFSSLISVLSMLLLGGVNQVAVAANSVLAVQFFLIAATPFALAPFVNSRRTVDRSQRGAIPIPVLWLGGGFLAIASAVVTSYGHLSQQFVFIVLTVWAVSFLVRASRWVLLATSLAVATTVSVWVPLNVLGLVVLIVAVVWTMRVRWWPGLALVLLTAVVTFDAIVSSIVYLLGLQSSFAGGISAIVDRGSTADEDAVSLAGSGELIASAHLFRAPGAAEQTSPVLAVLAALVIVATAWFLSKRLDVAGRMGAVRLLPLGLLLGYTLVMTMADALVTGSSPNYGASKMAFTLVVIAIAAGIPFAVMAIDPDALGMTMLRWTALAAVVAVLLFDSLLPRAVSALSPLLWKGVDPAAPVYWSAAEVRDSAEQPISRNPIACLFAPPESTEPTALPLGQESYSCTRLLIGLAGLEGEANILGEWLLTDWQSQSQTWGEVRDSLEKNLGNLSSRSVIVMNKDGGLAGITSLGELIDRSPASR